MWSLGFYVYDSWDNNWISCDATRWRPTWWDISTLSFYGITTKGDIWWLCLWMGRNCDELCTRVLYPCSVFPRRFSRLHTQVFRKISGKTTRWILFAKYQLDGTGDYCLVLTEFIGLLSLCKPTKPVVLLSDEQFPSTIKRAPEKWYNKGACLNIRFKSLKLCSLANQSVNIWTVDAAGNLHVLDGGIYERMELQKAQITRRN